MNKFIILFQKEMVESVKNGKWIWLPVVMILIGITQPITNYYMPQILEMAGNLPEGAVIELPTPTGEEVLIGTLSQYGTIGTLLIVLSVMGVISNERQNGTLTLVMVRPVRPIQYIISKWAAHGLIVVLSFFLSYSLTWYYTNLLFTKIEFGTMIASFAMYSLWLIFVVTVTIFFGTLLTTAAGIAGTTVTILATLSVASSLFTSYLKWSPATVRTQVASFLLEGMWEQTALTIVITSVLIVALLLVGAVFNFKRIEQY